MTIRIDRVRMAMSGNFYAYDALVPASQVDCTNIHHFTLKDGEQFVSLADATRPAVLDTMPRGVARYDAYMAHSRACDARLLGYAQSVYPELADVPKWPSCFVELPSLVASHDSREVKA